MNFAKLKTGVLKNRAVSFIIIFLVYAVATACGKEQNMIEASGYKIELGGIKSKSGGIKGEPCDCGKVEYD